MDRYIRKTD